MASHDRQTSPSRARAPEEEPSAGLLSACWRSPLVEQGPQGEAERRGTSDGVLDVVFDELACDDEGFGERSHCQRSKPPAHVMWPEPR